MVIYGKYMENRWEIDGKNGDLWEIYRKIYGKWDDLWEIDGKQMGNR